MGRSLPERWCRLALAAPLAAVVAVTDLGTKAAAAASLEVGERVPVFPAVDLVHVRNPGVAFGLLAASGPLLVAALAVAFAVLAVALALRAGGSLAWLAAGLLLGGAAGNLADRLRDGYVTDWLDLPLWPSFNVADVAIVAGVLALLAAGEPVVRGRAA